MRNDSFDAGQLTLDYIRSLVKSRDSSSHKGDYGHAMLIAGSYGMMGAAILAARACMRSGAGLLTAHVPAAGYSIMQTSVPEVMCITDPSERVFSASLPVDKYDALAVGPGLGRDEVTIRAFEILLRSEPRRLLLDADALNILAQERWLFDLLPMKCVFTPHIKEFSRMMGTEVNSENRNELQKAFSTEHSAVVVLKGAGTTISTPEGKIFKNTTGNPGMATAGSGDVLTGIILGLLAQGYSNVDAACIGVFVHGLAGDIAVRDTTEISMVAGDIVDYLPKAFKELI